jgi:hypothetical protein
MVSNIKSALQEIPTSKKVAIMCATEVMQQLKQLDERQDVVYFDLGSLKNPESAMKMLYSYLLESDSQGVDNLVVHLYDNVGSGSTYNERVNRAAGE